MLLEIATSLESECKHRKEFQNHLTLFPHYTDGKSEAYRSFEWPNLKAQLLAEPR
jgi:hypothetical protein